MGVYINLNISYSVAKEEWEAVYSEILELIQVLPGINQGEECDGKNMISLVLDDDTEAYVLYRDLIQQKKYNKMAGDAIWGALPVYTDFGSNDPRCNRCYEIWGPKINRKTYYLHLLAIACLIEDRLGEKAFLFGNITGEQCKRAVKLANKYLKKRIDVPARCDMKRLRERLGKMRLSEQEKLTAFESMYWGNKDYQFGEYLRKSFSQEACDLYWRKRFQDCSVGTVRFRKNVNDFLSWGFEWSLLCRLVNQEE